MTKIDISSAYETSMWGRYKLGKVLGKGVYGEVRQATSPTGELFAIKHFTERKENVDSPDEIAISLQAKHPHMIRGVEYFYEGEEDYLVLELADTNLQDFVFFTFPSNEERIRLFYQLVSAVTYLQDSGFYHCDIKPVNVLIKDGEVKLADLGLTKYSNVQRQTCQSYPSPQTVTINYRASGFRTRVDKELEDIFYQPANNFANDVWALGITFVFLLTGRVLFYDVEEAQQVLDYLQSYVRHPRDYLLQHALPEEWLPLVLQMLEPRADLRLPLARDILLQPEFVSRGLYQPVPGSASIFYSLPLYEATNPNLRRMAEWMQDIMEEERENSFVVHSAITCFYYMIRYLTPDPKVTNKATLLASACITLMSSIYSIEPMDRYTLIYYARNRFTLQQLAAEERRIMLKLQGRLYFTTLPKLAFSERAVEKSKELLLDAPRYLVTNLEEYMSSLLSQETIEERNNRRPVW